MICFTHTTSAGGALWRSELTPAGSVKLAKLFFSANSFAGGGEL